MGAPNAVLEGELRLRPTMDMSDIKSNIGVLQNQFNKLKLPSGIADKFNQELNKFSTAYDKYQQKMSQGIKTKGDATQTSKYLNEIAKEYDNIVKMYSKVSGMDLKSMFKIDSGPLKDAAAEVEKFTNQLANVNIDKTGFKNLGQQLSGILKNSKFSGENGLINQLVGYFDNGEVEKAKAALQELNKEVEKRQYATVTDKSGNIVQKPGTYSQDNTTAALSLINQMIAAAEQAGIKIQDIQGPLNAATKNFDQLLNSGINTFKNIGNAAQKERSAVQGVVEQNKNLVNSMWSAQSQSQMLTNRIAMYFGLYNILRKITDVAKRAFQTVKELDASMTETAVVTNFSVGDMWEKLPQYTAAANQLGSTIKDVYDATTLYYQQGLNSSQAMGVAVETLKMARIGGIEAAEATDMMTAALRGFNMQINELSAQRINDVYSKLAAITASNTEELGSAMTRTASIANSAGMEFETTSAFLAQMIETTREAPENLGTAMKTIIARFQELKKSPEEFIDEDGTVTSVNRVDTALRSVGVSLTDAQGNFRKLDDVFLDLASRWDTLSQGQQRYVATMAAGSRQQSRFIAMMSNYERTMELVNAANTSAGASQEQFNKTLESMSTKLNKLKNAWDQFAMGLTNNTILKGAIDGLTTGVTVINKFVDVIGKISPKPFANINKSIVTLVGTLGALRIAGGAIFKHRGLLGEGIVGAQSFFMGNSFSQIQIDMQKAVAEAQGTAATGGQKIGETIKQGVEQGASNINIGDKIQQNLQAIQLQDFNKDPNAALLSLDMAIDKSSAADNCKAAAQQLLAGMQEAIDNGQKIDISRAIDQTAGILGIDPKQLQELMPKNVHFDAAANQYSQSMLDLTTRTRQFGMALQGTPLAPFGNLLIRASTFMGGFSKAFSEAGKAAQAAGGGIKGFSAGAKELWKQMGTMGHLVVVVLALVAAYKALDYIMNHTTRTLKAQANAAADDLGSMKQEVSELNDKLNQISEGESAFNGLIVGSADFNAKLLETNQLIDELIEKYPLLDNEKYIKTDENGLKSITQAGIDAVKDEVNGRLATAQALKALTANAKKQNSLQGEIGQLYNQKSTQSHSSLYNSNKIRDEKGNVISEEDIQKQIDKLVEEQNVENQKTYESLASSIANSNSQVKNKDLVKNIIAKGYEGILDNIKNGTQEEMGKAYAELKGWTFDKTDKKFTNEKGEDVTEQAKKGGWDDQQIYKYIKAAEQARDLMPQIEEAASDLDDAFENAWKTGSEGGTSFIKDLLSGNTDIDRDALQAFTKKNSKLADKIVKNLNEEQIKAFGKTNKKEVANYLEQLASDMQETIKKEQQQLGAMAFKAAGVLNIGENGEATFNNKEKAAQIANQISQLTTAQRGLLNTAGEQLQTYGIDTMSKFMNGMLAIYNNAYNGATDKIKERAGEATSEIEEALKGVDLSNPTQALVTFTKLSKSSTAEVNKFGKELLKTQGFAELLRDSLLDVTSSPSWSEAMKNSDQFQDSVGNFTAEGVMKLSEQVSGLDSLLQEGIISAGAFAAALNFNDGEAGLSNLNSFTLKLLDSLTSLDSLAAKVHNDLANIDFGLDTGEADDAIKENVKRIKELRENYEVGNPELHNRIKSIVGPEAWEKALQNNGFDLEKTVDKFMPLINKLSDGFMGAWDKMSDGISLTGKNINTLSKEEEKLFTDRQKGISTGWTPNGEWDLKTNGATEKELLEWLKVKNGVNDETAEQLLITFKNFSPDLDKEIASNNVTALMNDRKFMNDTLKENGNKLFMTSQSLEMAGEALEAAGTGWNEESLTKALKSSAEAEKGKFIEVKNTKENGELITSFKALDKNLNKALGGKWFDKLVETNEKTKKTTVDVAGAESQLKITGIADEQIYTELYGKIQEQLKNTPNAEFDYNGIKLKDIDQIKSAEELKQAIIEASSPENQQWQAAAETCGDIIAKAITDVLKPDDINNDTHTASGEKEVTGKAPEHTSGTTKTETGHGITSYFDKPGTKTNTVPISGGSIRVGTSGSLELPKNNFLTNLLNTVTFGGAFSKGSGISNTVITDFISNLLNGSGIKGAAAGAYQNYSIKNNSQQSSQKISEESNENIEQTSAAIQKTNSDFQTMNSTLSTMGTTLSNTQTNTDAASSSQKKYGNLLDYVSKSGGTFTDELGNIYDANGKLIDNFKTAGTTIEKLGTSTKTSTKEIQEQLNKMASPSQLTKGSNDKKEQGNTIPQAVQKAEVQDQKTKYKVETDDSALDETKEKVENTNNSIEKPHWYKIQEKYIPSKTNPSKSQSKTKTESRKLNYTEGSVYTPKGEFNRTINYTKGHVYEPSKTFSRTINYSTGSVEPVSMQTATLKLNLSNGSDTIHVSLAAKGMNNNYSTDSLPALGSLAAGTRKGRIGPKGKGGLTLTGEEGYEIAWLPSENRSMILGANGPEMLNLPSDAVVWTHDQSKRIIKKNAIPGGTAAIGAGSAAHGPQRRKRKDGDDSGGNNNNNNNNNNSNNKKNKNKEEILAKNRYKQYQVAWKVLKKAGKISTWWENISKQVAAAEKLADRNQKVFERTLTKVGTTLSDAEKAAQNYAKYLGLQVKYNTRIFKTYNNKLTAIDKGQVKKNGKYVNQGITTSGGKKLTGTAAGDYIVKQANKTGKTIKKGKNKGKRKGGVLGELNRLQTQLAAAEETDSKKDDKIIKQRIRKLKKSNRYKKWLKKVQKNEGLQTVGWDENERITYKYTDKKGRKRTKTKTKKVKRKEAVNLSKYIYRDEETGEYLIDYKKINKRKNASKAERKAIKEAAQKKVDEINKRRNDALEKTINSVEAIQKIGQDIYDNFYGWKNELTEIWNITRKITELESDSSKFTGMYELYQADLAAGLKEATLDFIKEGVDFFNADVMAKTLAIDEYMKSIPQLQQDLLYAKDRPDLQQLVKDLTEQFNNTKAGKYINQRDKYDPNNPKQIAKWEAAAAKAEKQKDYKEAERLKGEINAAKEVLKIAQLSSEYFTITQRGDNSFTVDFDSQKFEDARLSNKGGIGTETYNKMKDYIDNIIDINNQLNEQMTTAVQKITELRNDLQEIREQYADYADDLLSAYEDHKKAEVDRLENIYNCLNDHIKNLLDKVKKNLDKRRQQEDNNKTEEDINDKQQRLARLRASTSNGNRAEILKLEKEIADAQNSYGRTLEDQLLSSLEEQADEASKQRERQIKLLNAQLQLDHLTGKNAAHIDQLLADIQSDNKVTRQAALKEITDLHKEQSNYYTHPTARKVILDSELQTQINELTNYEERKLYIEAAINATDGYIAQLKASFDTLAKEIREKFIEEHGEPEPVETPKLPLDFNAYQTLLGGQGSKQVLEKVIPTLEGFLDEYRDTLSDEELAKWEDLLDKLKKKLDWFNNPANFTNGGTSLSNLIADGASAANKPSEPPKTEEVGNLSNGGAKDTPLKTYQDYVAKVNKGSDITAAQFKTARTYATNAKVSMTDMGKALVKGSGNPTWKQLMKAAKAAGVTQKQAKTWWGGVSDTAAAAIDDWKKYAKGGFADFTGPAWLDGTRAKPEAVLSATDTKNFVQLRDILSDVMGHISNSETSYGNVTYDIDVNVERLASDYDVDKVAKRIEKIITKDASYRNVTQVRKFR